MNTAAHANKPADAPQVSPTNEASLDTELRPLYLNIQDHNSNYGCHARPALQHSPPALGRLNDTATALEPLNAVSQRYLHPAQTSNTCLLLVDIQRGLNTTHGFYGTERSTPQFEENISSLLAAFRANNELMIHVFHQSSNPGSPLHISGKAQRDGMFFMPCAQPNETSPLEYVVSKMANSAFTGTTVRGLLEVHRIAQIVVVGIATDHCVSTSVRWAKDLEVVKDYEEDTEGRIAIVSDATACFGKGGVDAETVQKVHFASLDGEFAKVMSTEEMLEDLFD